MHPRFHIDIVDRGASVYVKIEGELDIATAPLLSEKIAAAESTDASLIVVDLTRVSFMDSTGLQALAAHLHSQQNGGRLRITQGAPQVKRLFELIGVLEASPSSPQLPDSARRQRRRPGQAWPGSESAIAEPPQRERQSDGSVHLPVLEFARAG